MLPGQGNIDRSGDASTVACDDPSYSDEGTFFGEGAPPSLLEDVPKLPEDFIFDQRGASEAMELSETNLNNPLWALNTYNKNLIIPQQFYYNDYLSDSMFFRNPSEQEDPRYNFGSLATVLNDDFRYCCGGTWDHTSVVFGEPTTVYESALRIDFEKERVPNLDSPKSARLNRGLLFYKIEPISSIIEGTPDPDNEGLQKFYMSGLDLYASGVYLDRVFSNLQRRQIQRDELPGLLYNFIFDSTAQQLEVEDELLDNRMEAFRRRMDVQGLLGVENDDIRTTESVNVITTTYYSKNFFDHTFQAPAGYSRSYAGFYPAIAGDNDLVEITSHAPPGDLQVQDSSDQGFSDEFSRASFYRSLGEYYRTILLPDAQEMGLVQPVSTLEACRSDEIQKFPHNQVVRAKAMTDYLHGNSSIHEEQDEGVSTFVREFYENFDSYNCISFNMNKPSKVSEWLEQTSLTTIFFEMLDQVYPNNSTFYAQVLDAWLNNSETLLNRREQDSNFRIDSDLAAVNLRPNEIPYPFTVMKQMLSNQDFLGRPYSQFEGKIDTYTYPLGFDRQVVYEQGAENQFMDIAREKLLETEKFFWSTEETTLYQAIDKYRDYNSIWDRSAFDIFRGKPSYSQVLAYRIEKSETETGNVIQNFFFANTPQVGEFKFLDTQVVPGKRYTYKIFTINFVVGSKYNYETNGMSYEMVNLLDQTQNEFRRYDSTTTKEELFGMSKTVRLRLPISIEPDIRLIEAPYYEQEITTVSSDLPPLHPDVSVAESHRTTQNYLEPTMFILTPQFGHSIEYPVAMTAEDERHIQVMRENQESSYPLLPTNLIRRSPDQIIYRSDTVPTHYEMFYSFRRPTGYGDLFESSMLSTSADQPFFDLDVPLNTEFFVTFRTRDNGGISNPGPIYEFIKHNYGDGTYFSFEVLEIYPQESNLTFENLISIEPSIYQRSVDIDPDHTTLFYTYNHYRRIRGGILRDNPIDYAAMRSDQKNFIPFSTVPPTMDLISLGNSNLLGQDLIWNRKFKFRITSTTSGNSFDLNTSFEYSKIILEPELQPNSRDGQQCNDTRSNQLDNRRRRNAGYSNRGLNKVGGTTYNETSFISIRTDEFDPSYTGFLNSATAAEQAAEAYGNYGESGLGRGWDESARRAREGGSQFTERSEFEFQDRAEGMEALRTGEAGTSGRLGGSIIMSPPGRGGYQ